MRMTSKGQVTIPQALREKVGLLPYTEVEFELDGKAVRIKPARRRRRKLTREQLRRYKDLPEFVRNMIGRGDGTMTTDEIMALTRGE